MADARPARRSYPRHRVGRTARRQPLDADLTAIRDRVRAVLLSSLPPEEAWERWALLYPEEPPLDRATGR